MASTEFASSNNNNNNNTMATNNDFEYDEKTTIQHSCCCIASKKLVEVNKYELRKQCLKSSHRNIFLISGDWGSFEIYLT